MRFPKKVLPTYADRLLRKVALRFFAHEIPDFLGDPSNGRLAYPTESDLEPEALLTNEPEVFAGFPHGHLPGLGLFDPYQPPRSCSPHPSVVSVRHGGHSYCPARGFQEHGSATHGDVIPLTRRRGGAMILSVVGDVRL